MTEIMQGCAQGSSASRSVPLTISLTHSLQEAQDQSGLPVHSRFLSVESLGAGDECLAKPFEYVLYFFHDMVSQVQPQGETPRNKIYYIHRF